MADPIGTNVVWHDHRLAKADHRRRNGHPSCLFWFTGLPGSGKSTLAGAVEEAMNRQGVNTYLLGGDNVRNGLNRDLGFSDADREENIRRIGEVARLFVDAGAVSRVADYPQAGAVVLSGSSPNLDVGDRVRAIRA